MRSIAIIFCAILILFSFSQVQATIIHVPGDSSTIQGGINGAVNGDTVLVAPGTYYEHINFYGKAILVRGEAGAEITIINKLYDGLPIATFTSGEDSSSILDGFTIQNATNSTGNGGGVYCYDHSSPTIRNNIIKQNAAHRGAGVACYFYSSPRIENNRIIENISGYQGGGISCVDYSSPSIIDNTLIGNMADRGGAISCDYSYSTQPTIDGNLLIENRASYGAAIHCNSYSSPNIFNNTLDRNICSHGASGSIHCQGSCSPMVKNVIVSNDQIYGVYATNNSFPVITYSDIWNNGYGNFFGCMPGAGCISADPIFCDTTSDNYYLSGGSPCVGAGESGVDIGALGIGCGNLPYDVQLTAGSDKSGRTQTAVQVEFYVRNMGFLSDTYDLNITDSLGWTIVPTQYTIPLDSGKVDTAAFTVSIPYVPIGTVDKLRLTAVSQADTSIHDVAYLTVTCNAIVEGVEVNAGGNQSGYADSIVSVAFLVENVGVVPDSYSLDISDTRGWNIEPLHYDLVLDTAESYPVSFTVSIPYVSLGTVDELTLLAVSKTNPLARDSASLNVTCNAYVEDWELTAGDDLSGSSNSQVTAVFYVQNTGLATDSCFLTVFDSLSWYIQSQQDSLLILNPGQQDSVFFDIQIPAVPVGTTNKVTLAGVSLTNPYVWDETSLLVTCESYNVTITEISDVGNDEGRQARIYWSSFPGDDPLVTHFTIYRRVDPTLIALTGVQSKAFSTKDYPPGDWDMIGTYPAYGDTEYLAVVPTLKDSTISEGIHWSVFFIRAGTDTPLLYFDSPVDSGYSLDNLSPSPPTGLFASHEPAVTILAWGATTSPDFDYYTVYRDTLEGFTPGPSNRLGYTIHTSFVDSSTELGRTYYYLTSATDFSGNESDPSNEALGVRYITGDLNSDGVIDVGDVVYLVGYLYRNGPAPSPVESGDVNCDGVVNIGDVVYLINYLFRGGPPPCE